MRVCAGGGWRGSRPCAGDREVAGAGPGKAVPPRPAVSALCPLQARPPAVAATPEPREGCARGCEVCAENCRRPEGRAPSGLWR